MKKQKRRLERFSFYDHSQIERRLETMAAQGWMLEKAGSLIWTYRRTEPKILHVSVVYFADASPYDPGPTAGQLEMAEFCARDGWKLMARWGQMQIFYNEQEDPVPIETDPVTQVAAIHRAMKKQFLPAQFMEMAMFAYLVIFYAFRFRNDPVRFLSSPIDLYFGCSMLLTLPVPLIETGVYFHWYRKARRAAENGEFAEMKTRHRLVWSLIVLSLFPLLLAVLGSGFGRTALLLGLGLTLLTVAVTLGISALLKKKQASRSLNRGVTVTAALLLSLAVMSGLTAWILGKNRLADLPVRTEQTADGREFSVSGDKIPLELGDFMELPPVDWTMKAERNETLLLARTAYRQWPAERQQDVPFLSYTVTEVKIPALYAFCKENLLAQKQDTVQDGAVILANHYEPSDAAPWGVREAYRLFWSGDFLNTYLLCMEDRFVEIQLETEPDAAQMARIAEQLNP